MRGCTGYASIRWLAVLQFSVSWIELFRWKETSRFVPPSRPRRMCRTEIFAREGTQGLLAMTNGANHALFAVRILPFKGGNQQRNRLGVPNPTEMNKWVVPTPRSMRDNMMT